MIAYYTSVWDSPCIHEGRRQVSNLKQHVQPVPWEELDRLKATINLPSGMMSDGNVNIVNTGRRLQEVRVLEKNIEKL